MGEAAAWAKLSGDTIITAKHIKKAIEQKRTKAKKCMKKNLEKC